MSEPPPIPLTTGQRVLRAFRGAFALFFLVYFVWAVIQFGVAANYTGRASETLGYSAIFTSPLAGLLAALVGAVLGWITPPGRLRWRAFYTTLVFAMLAGGFAAYLLSTTK